MNNRRYVRVSQALLDWMPNRGSLNVEELTKLAEDLGKEDYLYFDNEVPRLLYASIIYEITNEGRLLYVKDKLDTSG